VAMLTPEHRRILVQDMEPGDTEPRDTAPRDTAPRDTRDPDVRSPLPERVRRAAEQHRRQHPPLPAHPAPIRAGDIRRVHWEETTRIAYVQRDPHQDPDDGTTSVVIALVHPYTEYATDADRILDPAASGVAYTLVIELDLLGVVFPDQLDAAPLARIATETLRNAPSGPRLTGPLDARWEFKQQELDDLRELVAACTAHALDRM